MKLVSLKYSFRYLKNNKVTTLIHIIGLSLGLFFVITAYTINYNENNYFKQHENADNIYILNNRYFLENKVISHHGTSAPLAPELKEKFPEIKYYTRLFGFKQSHLINVGHGDSNAEKIECKEGVYADESIFSVFTFKFLEGNLPIGESKDWAIITKKLEKKLFGRNDAVGKEITINNKSYFISGIVDDIVINTRQVIDLILPFSSLADSDINIKDYTNNEFLSYLLLENNTSISDFNEKLKSINNTSLALKTKVEHFIVSLKEGQSNEIQIIISILSIIALVIACLNFINLSNSKSIERRKEIANKKLFGASRFNLIAQALLETFIVVLLSTVISFILVKLFNPIFSQVLRYNISFSFNNLNFYLGILVIISITSFLAGFFPGFVLSNYSPLNIFKYNQAIKFTSINIRYLYVSVQFFVSICSILLVVFLYLQFKYMYNDYTGFNSNNLIVMNGQFNCSYDVLKNKLSNIDGIQLVTTSSDNPFSINSRVTNWGIKKENLNNLGYYSYVGFDYDKLFSLKIEDGRFYSNQYSNENSKIVLNEAAANLISNENLINQAFYLFDKPYQIIGVVKNFTFQPKSEEIAPLILILNDEINQNIYVKYRKNANLTELIHNIQSNLSDLTSDDNVNISFFEDEVKKSGQVNYKILNLFVYATVLSLLITTIGLVGLLIFVVERKMKEIAVRKVHGADKSEILALFYLEIGKPLLITLIIASAFSYFIIHKLFENYANHISINFLIFLFIFISVAIVIFSITIYPILKALRLNPVDILKHE